MEEIAISKFKSTCLAVLEQVRKTGKPIRITRFGKAIADVMPPADPERPQGWLGSMAGQCDIRGDIAEVSSSDLVDWEADQ